MNRLLRLLPLLLLLTLPHASHAQGTIVAGTPCGAGGLSAIATNGQAVLCQGNPLIWTATGGSGGGISSVAALPATCTPGGTNGQVFLTVASAGRPIGQYNCTLTNVFSFVGTNTGLTYNVSDFGVTNAGNHVLDMTCTNGSTTVTTSANDPAFTSAITGWAVWGTASGLDAVAYTNVVPIGTITFVSAHTATVSIAGGAGCAGTATQHLIWGPVEDTQLTAAENAAWNYAPSATQQGACYGLTLSSGFTVVKLPHFNTVNCNNAQTGTVSRGAYVQGANRATSLIAITPDFSLATCPAYNGLNTCFGAVNGLTKQNFGITGFQDPGNANPAAQTCMTQDAIDSATVNLFLTGFASARSNVIAYCTASINANALYLTEDGMGAIGALFTATNNSCDVCFFGENAALDFQTSGGNLQLTTHNVYYGSTAATTFNGMIQFISTGNSNWHSYGDTLFNATNNTNAIQCAATCIFTGLIQVAAAPVNFAVFYAHTAGGHIVIRDSVVQSGSGATSWIFLTDVANTIFDDAGENSFSATAGQVYSLTATAVVRTIEPSSTYTNAPAAGLTNCASTASPAVCRAWFDGASTIAATATSKVINTSVVGANSVIVVTFDSSLGTKLGVTCSTQSLLTTGTPFVSARTAGTSFTVAVQAADAANPICFSFSIRGTN